MKNIITLLVFVILTGFIISFFLIRINNEDTSLDSLKPALKKIEEILPESGVVYYFSILNTHEFFVPDDSLATLNATDRDVLLKVQFWLVPGIVQIREYKYIPKNSFILMVQDKKISSSRLKMRELFAGSDSISSYNDKSYMITLLKKKE
jgi:hypothetical protein